jgi:CDP-diacylglycerol--serine O-phosphatidyltransferase
MNRLSIIPNTFTSLNLAFGFLSITRTLESDYFFAGVCIILAMLADALDGRTARYFGVSGDFGKELDSLSDVVSFGVAPAVLLFAMHLKESLFYLAPAIIFAVCAALRLARFNLNTTAVKGYFMGLPSPAGGCFLATFAISGLKAPAFYVACGVLIAGLLMYSGVRYPDFKGKNTPIRKPAAVLAVILAAYLVYILPPAAIPFSLFFSFILMGVVNHFYVSCTGGYDKP